MNYDGLIVGAATFLIIGLFHPLVIKAERVKQGKYPKNPKRKIAAWQDS